VSSIPEITSGYADDYKRIQVAGIFGGVRPYGVSAVLYSESMDVEKALGQIIDPSRTKLKRVAECELMIDPMQLKSLHRWFGDQIVHYEKLFGPIPSPEELESREKHSGE